MYNIIYIVYTLTYKYKFIIIFKIEKDKSNIFSYNYRFTIHKNIKKRQKNVCFFIFRF